MSKFKKMNRSQYKNRTERILEAASNSIKDIYDFADDDSNSIFDDSDMDPSFEPYTSNQQSTSDDSSSIILSNSDESVIIPLQTSINLNSSFEPNIMIKKSIKDINSEVSHANDNDVQNLFHEQPTSSVLEKSTFSSDQDKVVQEQSQSVFTTIKQYPKKKKTYCKLCTLEVTNFERHLERNHKDSEKVIEMLSFPKKSKQRRQIIGLLRNDGHFEEFLKGNVRPIYNLKNKSNVTYYPCVNCKGLYSKLFLSRHQRKCIANPDTNVIGKTRHLSNSQTVIACALNKNIALHKLRVKEEVFNIMKADEISLTAKSDVLICHFGEQYLKKHNRKQMATVCSSKMRELSRLLIECRRSQNNKSITLADLIDPSYFDTVVECAKRIGGYDPEKKTFSAPSLSAHIGTSLKQVSELLLRIILKNDSTLKFTNSEKKIKDAERFRDLVSSQWTTEISSLAFKTLNETKWKKPSILPLSKDILKFKDYVTLIANKASVALQENSNNKQEYRKLVDATLTLTILYNRRRIGDVQYTKLESYNQNFSSINQEECLNSLSESEKVLTKHYKRIVTGGKGSRPIVILFPPNLQNFMEVILKIRHSTNLVPSNNPYLFAYPNSERWARADTTIRNFAKKANLNHPREISSNKLRKQIATVMQILNMNQEETEQFANFMGHTEKTHNDFYKLPQDIYQTAKISKLLILMDKGSGHNYKGKSLNEININPEEDFPEESENSDTEEPMVQIPTVSSNIESSDSEPSTTKNNGKSLKLTGRSTWSAEQIKVVTDNFKSHIKNKKAPKKHECEILIQKYPHILCNKDWVRVKTYIYNVYRNK